MVTSVDSNPSYHRLALPIALLKEAPARPNRGRDSYRDGSEANRAVKQSVEARQPGRRETEGDGDGDG